MGYADLNIPDGGQEDFRVKAEAGYLVPDYGGHILPMPLSYDFMSFGDSGWSNIQTITIGSGDVTTSETTPSPTPLTTPTEFGTLLPTPSSSATQNPTAPPIQPDTHTGVLLGLDWEHVVIIALVVVVAVLAVGLVALWRRMPKK